jgi:hypothetical protein
MTKYRIDFTEVLPGRRHEKQSILVAGTLDDVQDRMDRFNWIIESAHVTEYVGSDAVGRTVPLNEWYQG